MIQFEDLEIERTRAAGATEAIAAQLRSETILNATNQIRTMLSADRENSILANTGLWPADRPVPIYVFRHALEVPYQGAGPVYARSLLLKHRNSNGLSSDDEMRVYVPCDRTGYPLETPDLVFADRKAPNGTIHRFAITRKGFHQSSPSTDLSINVSLPFSDEDFVRIRPAISDDDLERLLQPDMGMPDLSSIAEDLLNMDVIPQKSYLVGLPKTEASGADF